MQIVLNSKFFGALSVGQLGAKAVELGFDGIDICVRPNHPIHLANASAMLPTATAIWRDQGLVCPLATAPVDFIDPAASETERLYAACAAAGIPRLKIGFWVFKPGTDYWNLVNSARECLDGFVRFSEEYGVQTCYQIHSGPCIGSNCAGLMHLIQGFDPEHLGAYPDLGHLVLDGEDWALGLTMIRAHLAVIGIKDALYLHQPDKEPPYVPCFVKAGDGCVDWARCLKILREFEFEGPLAVHTEYRFDESIIRQVGYAEATPPNLEEWARADAVFLRQRLAQAGAGASSSM